MLVQGLVKRYGARRALAGVDLRVEAGACFALFGPNGSGKTTLLRILCGLTAPTEGTVQVAGLSMASPAGLAVASPAGRALPSRAAEVRARLGVVLDHHLLPADLSLREALSWYASLYGVEHAAERIDELAERLDLGWRLRDPVRTLSRGMAQRAGLARALLHDPEVLLLDEPYTGLDAAASAVLDGLVRDAPARGRAVVLVTHDLGHGASLATSGAVLDRGKVVYHGPAAQAEQAARELFGRSRVSGGRPAGEGAA